MSKNEARDILDEAMRESLIKKVLTYAIGIALLLSLISGIITYNNYRLERIAKSKSKVIGELLDKIDHGDVEQRQEGIEALRAVSDGKTAYSAIAGFYLAQLYSMEEAMSKVILEYEKIAEKADYPDYIRHYAAFSAILAKVMNGVMKQEEAAAALDVLLKTKGFPFSLSAKLLQSVWIASYDVKAANAVLDQLIYDAEFLESASAMAKAMKHYNISRATMKGDEGKVNIKDVSKKNKKK